MLTAMAELKTRPTDEDADAFLDRLAEPVRTDCRELRTLMSAQIGAEPVLWGSGIVGFGSQHLRYASGRELDWFVAGFAPRAKAITLYLTCGLEQHADLLARLGRHTTGKGCLYLKRLDDVDREVLVELIRASAAEAPTR